MTTDDAPIREPGQIRQDCARKLRAVQVSDHFQAILGCLLGEDWTTPSTTAQVGLSCNAQMPASKRLTVSCQCGQVSLA